MAFFVVLDYSPISSLSSSGPGREHPETPLEDRKLKNGRYKDMGRANKIAPAASQTVDRGKEVMKMINCDMSSVITILLILLTVAAGLLMYALCVVSKNADELAENIYSRMMQQENKIDNHSHWEK